MELSGVDRLLTVARELGVKATGPTTIRERANATAAVKRDGDGDGIRLSLSSVARSESTARSESVARGESTARSESVARGESTARNVDVDGLRNEVLGVRGDAAPNDAAASRPVGTDERTPAPGSALDAYRRSAGSAPVGERIRIHA